MAGDIFDGSVFNFLKNLTQVLIFEGLFLEDWFILCLFEFLRSFFLQFSQVSDEIENEVLELFYLFLHKIVKNKDIVIYFFLQQFLLHCRVGFRNMRFILEVVNVFF